MTEHRKRLGPAHEPPGFRSTSPSTEDEGPLQASVGAATSARDNALATAETMHVEITFRITRWFIGPAIEALFVRRRALREISA